MSPHTMMSPRSPAAEGDPWWKGRRGEWYVIGQEALILLVFFGPRTLPGRPDWPLLSPHAYRLTGGVLMLAGGVLLAAGVFSMGRTLTPMPYPKARADYVKSGAYRLVRHPMYGGGIVVALGWALYVQGWLTLLYAAALALLLDRKARREEKWLVARFPTYTDYQRRVRKFIPFLH